MIEQYIQLRDFLENQITREHRITVARANAIFLPKLRFIELDLIPIYMDSEFVSDSPPRVRRIPSELCIQTNHSLISVQRTLVWWSIFRGEMIISLPSTLWIFVRMIRWSSVDFQVIAAEFRWCIVNSVLIDLRAQSIFSLLSSAHVL